jgi:hypothetical protein
MPIEEDGGNKLVLNIADTRRRTCVEVRDNLNEKTGGRIRICESETNGRNWQEISVSLCVEGKQREEPAWMFAVGRRISPALSVGSKWNERHESNYPLSPTIYALPHRPSDNMGLRDRVRNGVRNFLHLPPKDRRARSEGRSEAGPIVDPSEVILALPRLAESTPDLGIGPTSVPSTSQNLESGGKYANNFVSGDPLSDHWKHRQL